MCSGSHVQLAALRNRDLELQTTSPFSNHGSVERSAACFRHKNVLVLLGFQKFPFFFCVTLYYQGNHTDEDDACGRQQKCTEGFGEAT